MTKKRVNPLLDWREPNKFHQGVSGLFFWLNDFSRAAPKGSFAAKFYAALRDSVYYVPRALAEHYAALDPEARAYWTDYRLTKGVDRDEDDYPLNGEYPATQLVKFVVHKAELYGVETADAKAWLRSEDGRFAVPALKPKPGTTKIIKASESISSV